MQTLDAGALRDLIVPVPVPVPVTGTAVAQGSSAATPDCDARPATTCSDTAGSSLRIYRGDLENGMLSGNKGWKLEGWIQTLLSSSDAGSPLVVSAGGRWSNHLHALAHACRQAGLPMIALVRGWPGQVPSATLLDLQALGVRVVLLGRKDWSHRTDAHWRAAFLDQLPGCKGRSFSWIPDGGAGYPALSGLVRWAHRIASSCSGRCQLLLPVGTGTTLAGLRRALPDRFQLIGVPVAGDVARVRENIHSLLAGAPVCTAGAGHGRSSGVVESAEAEQSGWALWPAVTGTVFGKIDAEGIRQICAIEQATGLPLDPVYTWPALRTLLAGATDLSNFVFLHTGGLQGRRGVGLPYPLSRT